MLVAASGEGGADRMGSDGCWLLGALATGVHVFVSQGQPDGGRWSGGEPWSKVVHGGRAPMGSAEDDLR